MRQLLDDPPLLRLLLQHQDGLLARRQALGLGLSESAVRHALGPRGGWQRVLPRVYATFTGPLDGQHQRRAALLLVDAPLEWPPPMGPGRPMLSGDAGCDLHGLRYRPRRQPLMVLVPRSWSRTSQGFVRVRRTDRLPDVQVLRGLVVAPPWRSVVDACVPLTGRPPTLREVRALACEVVQRRLATVDALAEEVRLGPRRGSALLRTVLRDIQAGCRSAPECEFRDLVLGSRRIPEPRWNAPVPGVAGVVGDAVWDAVQLVGEVDSAEFHDRGAGPERTRQRQSRLLAAGWRTFPVSPRRLREQPAVVLAELEAAYLASGSDTAHPTRSSSTSRVVVAPAEATTRRSAGFSPGAKVRTVQCPGAAKKRNAPPASVGTSAVNSPPASSRRT